MQWADSVNAEMLKLSSPTINSAVFAIKDSARPRVTTDITDIKDRIEGMQWPELNPAPATGERPK